ncbi:MAG: pseudaminic acid biosynthesis-associated methylase [Xanthobacteraceae bacterium]
MTKQTDLWKSEFGDEYAARERNRITPEGQRALVRDWGRILAHAVTPKPESALEVGSNIGRNLLALRNFIPEMHAVEPNATACRAVRENSEIEIASLHNCAGDALPFGDGSVDLVFTSGVLIHIPPDSLGRTVDEIYRVARKYIVCIEYFSHEPTEVKYRGLSGYLFKRDFGKFYLDRHPSLRVLDYGFLWQVLDSSDNTNWWLFSK